MIKSIHLINFQGHRANDLELHPGINVVAGESDSGKSSIIRALWWLVRNRPAGAADSFRNWGAGAKDEVAVGIELDNGHIARFRRGTTNGYEVNGETLVAVRADVPKEVSNLLNLGDHNIQTQHPIQGSSPYFLVADSPGDVARKLNEVCGLDIIDECIKNAGLLVSRNSQSLAESERRINELEESRRNYDDLDMREHRVLALEAKDARRTKIRNDLDKLEKALASAKVFHSKLADLSGFLEIEKPAANLVVLAGRVDGLSNRIGQLDLLIANAKKQSNDTIELKSEIERVNREFHDALESEGVCPLCGQPTIGG